MCPWVSDTRDLSESITYITNRGLMLTTDMSYMPLDKRAGDTSPNSRLHGHGRQCTGSSHMVNIQKTQGLHVWVKWTQQH